MENLKYKVNERRETEKQIDLIFKKEDQNFEI